MHSARLGSQGEARFLSSVMQIGYSETSFFFQLDVLYEGYKRTRMKQIPKVNQLIEWLRENIPKDDKKPGRK